MADLRMPEGLSDDERQQWLEDLRVQLIEETGQLHGVVHQDVLGEQPVFGIWGTDPEPEDSDEVEPTHVPGLARTFDVPLAHEPSRSDPGGRGR